jgi:transposase InsO family protein/transposase-like protein
MSMAMYYSREERAVALQLHLEHNKSISEVICALGYPERSTLFRWLKIHRDELRTGEIKEINKRERKYSTAQKQTAVNHYLSTGRCYSNTVSSLGYPSRPTLRMWINETNHPLRKERNGIQYRRKQKIEAAAASVCAKAVHGEHDSINARLADAVQILAREEASVVMPKKTDRDLTEELNELRTELEQAKKDIYRAKLELAVLEKAAELIKKDPGIGPKELTNKEKAILVDALRNEYPLSTLIEMVEIPRSSYYYQKNVALKPDGYAEVRQAVRDSFEGSNRSYGYRRIWGEVRRAVGTVSEKVIRRIMKEESLAVKIKRRRKYSAYQGENDPSAENILDRDFHADAPNKKWLTDISEFHIPAGKVYLSPVVDCFDGLITSWTIGTHPDADLVNSMLDNAISTLGENEHPLVHSDRGCHYRWPGWISRIEDNGLTRSMSKKGCSPDNAACEGFFGRLKNEMFHNRSWDGVSIQGFMDILDKYVHWYNEKRIKMSLGAMSPLEYRRNLGLVA